MAGSECVRNLKNEKVWRSFVLPIIVFFPPIMCPFSPILCFYTFFFNFFYSLSFPFMSFFL
ncbi:hypothetical protein C0J52_20167 [Blattella germanica]|nr:hypothetical protein C0J52_20167 [Blattella germanica]